MSSMTTDVKQERVDVVESNNNPTTINQEEKNNTQDNAKNCGCCGRAIEKSQKLYYIHDENLEAYRKAFDDPNISKGVACNKCYHRQYRYSKTDNTTTANPSNGTEPLEQKKRKTTEEDIDTFENNTNTADNPSLMYDPNKPVTVLVKYLSEQTGNELYCTYIKLEKHPDTLQQLQQVTLKRWNDKCETTTDNPEMQTKNQVKSIQVRAMDRYNTQLKLDLDEFYFKDFTIFDNDLLYVTL
ncbi:hypothetical protein ABK040_012892 [Willaertia magna]